MSTTLNPTSFTLSLAEAMAALAGIDTAAAPRSLWVHQAVEAASTDPYTVLKLYGGASQDGFERLPQASIQAMTVGTDAAAVLALAWSIYGTLFTSENGIPRCHWSIDGKVIAAGAVGADPEGDWLVRWIKTMQAPGILGRDPDSGKWMASFNFDISFCRAQ